MSIAVRLDDVSKLFGEFVAVDDVSLDVGDGEFFALLGPSGCGKTTTLRMVAGFEQPTMGEVFIMGDAVAGIPAHKRPVNTVFQSYALFPHMTAAQNVAFGLQMSKVGKSETAERVKKALEMVQMGQFLDRKPKQLSGGQKQRIALARALVNRPKVLLLDEPLGALDLKLRKEMQIELKQIQSDVGITFIYVTHDQEEALTMSDRIAVMDHGMIKQVGTPRDIYERPNSRFVADFIGETNFIEGTAADDAAGNGEIVGFTAGSHTLMGMAEQPLKAGQSAALAIRPEKMRVLYRDQVDGIDTTVPYTLIDGTINGAMYIGTDTRYGVTLAAGQDVFVRAQNLVERDTPVFGVGEAVTLYWPALNAQVLVD